jgi:SAM-dependent methyltransferase
MCAVDHMLRATARAEARHFWFRGFRHFVAPLVRHATRGLTDARILDCGCGTGANLEFLGRFGRPYGFDVTPLGLLIGRTAGRPRLVRATVAAVPFPDNTFDLVTSFDVLYALPEPDERAAVAEMHRVTRPGGFVVVNVAAMDLLRGDHSMLVHEVRRYSRSSLRALLTGAGFSIERLTYTNATLFLPLAAARTLQRRRGLRREEEAGGDMAIPPEPLNSLLAGALRVESWWMRISNMPFGSSLLCLARKPA